MSHHLHSCCLHLLTLPDDHVFMENADKRREYVQNGNGKIFVGQYNNMTVFNWEYVQVSGWVLGTAVTTGVRMHLAAKCLSCLNGQCSLCVLLVLRCTSAHRCNYVIPSRSHSLPPPLHSPPLPRLSQFAPYSLNTALYLLDRFGLDPELRRNPVHVSRACATMVRRLITWDGPPG